MDMYLRHGNLSPDLLEVPTPLAGAAAEPSLDPARLLTPSPIGLDDAPPAASANGRTKNLRAHAPNTRHLPTVTLHGVRLHAVTEEGCIRHVLDELDAGRGGVVVTPNLDHLRRCVHDMRFGALVAEADLVVADGMPLVWASRLQGSPLPERVAGSDLISSLSAGAAERGRKIFMLGGAPGTAEKAAHVLRTRHPNIKIVGTYCPRMGFEKSEEGWQKIIDAVAPSAADIIYVALGSPKQELLIERVRKYLPNAWWLGVGNSFSFLCGEVRRAPRWMQKRGLEWIHRLVQEPRRLFRRYIVVGLPFACSLMGRAALVGVQRKFRHPAPPQLNGDAAVAVNGNGKSNGNGVKSANGSNGSEARRRARERTSDADPAIESPAIIRSPGDAATQTLARLRALVLLGGSVRPNSLTSSIGRSVLDLPLEQSATLLDHWVAHAQEVARSAGLTNLPVRVMVNRNSPEPSLLTPVPADQNNTGASPASAPAASCERYRTVRVERDLSEYRGTGGVLGDLAIDYADDDLILVANAAQVLMDPLPAIAAALAETRGDVGLVSHADGTPSGVMLITCGALRLIPKSGFVDMKEQALPSIASRFDVTVVHRRRPTGLPVRSLADYVGALRHLHRRKSGKSAVSDPMAEDWRPSFAIIEPGAAVDPAARVHDSVVLRGGRVETGAVLVRSVVCPGGTVRRDRSAVDQFVTAIDGKRR